MAKGTTLLIIFLTTIASLFIGISIGKKIGINLASSQSSNETPITIPSIVPSSTPPAMYQDSMLDITPGSTRSDTSLRTVNDVSYFTDKTCGYSFSIPTSFVQQKTTNAKSMIFADPDNPDEAIAATCAPNIPKPPVSSDNIESISIAGSPATLYHDKNPDGSSRDEVIVKHPTNGMEIIIAGYGESFQQTLDSFQFLP